MTEGGEDGHNNTRTQRDRDKEWGRGEGSEGRRVGRRREIEEWE